MEEQSAIGIWFQEEPRIWTSNITVSKIVNLSIKVMSAHQFTPSQPSSPVMKIKKKQNMQQLQHENTFIFKLHHENSQLNMINDSKIK